MKISSLLILFFSFFTTLSISGSHIKIVGETSDGITLHQEEVINIDVVRQTLIDLSHSGETIGIEFSDLAKPLIFAAEDIIVTATTIHISSAKHNFLLALVGDKLSMRVMSETEVLTLRTVDSTVKINSARTDLRDNILVEVGTSVDQHLLSVMGGMSNFMGHWITATIDIADAYDRLTDLQLIFSNPIQLNTNSKLFANNSPIIATGFLGQSWGTVICRETDVAVHITGLDIPGGRGHSNSGDTYCNIESGSDFDMAVVQGYSSGLRVSDFAHELGHTLGLGHEYGSVCSLDNGYFMCSFGTSKDPSEWNLSSSLIASAENQASNASCTGESDDTNECDYCRFTNFVTFEDMTFVPRGGGNIGEFVFSDCNTSITDQIHEISLETLGGCASENYEFYIVAAKYNSLPTIEFTDFPSNLTVTESPQKTELFGVLSIPDMQTGFSSIKFKVLNFVPASSSALPQVRLSIRHKKVGQANFSPDYPSHSIILRKKEIIAATPGQKWSEIVQVNNLDLNQIEDYKIHVTEDLDIDIDHSFKNCKFEFSPQTNLSITNANVSFIGDSKEESELKSCVDRWHGVEVVGSSNVTIENTIITNTTVGITVENGATATISDLDITNTLSGIQIDGGGALQLETATISGVSNTSGSGILLSANARAVIEDFSISKFQFGIRGNNQLGVTGIIEGTISDVEVGILMESSQPIIEYVTTADCVVGMYLSSCGGSMINHNTFGYSSVGAVVNHSPSSFISRNTIGTSTESGPNGLIMVSSGGSFVLENPMIKANRLGALIVGGGVVMEQCTLEVESSIGVASAGVQLVQNSGTHFVGNVIRANETSSALETIMCTGSNISNNGLFHYSESSDRTAAIRSLGSMDETIEANDIDGFFLVSQNGISQASGLMAQNSTVNTYDCNFIDESTEGLGVYYNADFHTIRGNHFLNSLIDMEIRSVVGRQEHHGNVFVNGSARATGLSSNQINLSQFTANCAHPNVPNLCPSDPVPVSGWIIPDPSTLAVYTCTGNIGPGLAPSDPTLCTYFTHLKTTKESLPEQFFVKLYHLLRLERVRDNYTLPDCIKQDSTLQALCGLVELVGVKTSLDSIATNETNTSALTMAQETYAQASIQGKETARGSLQQELTNVKQDLLDEMVRDSLSLDSLRSEIDLIQCSDSLLVKWKDILKAYITYIQEGEVAQGDRTMLVNEGQACSDRYGDAIHLARVMANTFTSTHYDVFDDCTSTGTSPRSAGKSVTTDITVYPNPSTGLINVDFDTPFTGSMTVVDLTGKVLLSKSIENLKGTTMQIQGAAGVYYLHCKNDEGIESIQKILFID